MIMTLEIVLILWALSLLIGLVQSHREIVKLKAELHSHILRHASDYILLCEENVKTYETIRAITKELSELRKKPIYKSTPTIRTPIRTPYWVGRN